MIISINYNITFSANDGQLFEDMLQKAMLECHMNILKSMTTNKNIELEASCRNLLAEYERIQQLITDSATVKEQ